MSELKPCPFCGGVGVLADTFTENNKTWFCYIHCKECGASISDSASSEEEVTNRVVKNWNTRYERTCQMNDTTRCDDGESRTWEWVCSACGSRFEHEYGRYVNYCPYCGAKVVDE